MVMLSILKKKHFNKPFKNTHVFYFSSFYKTYACTPLMVQPTKQESAIMQGLPRKSTNKNKSFSKLQNKTFKTLKPPMHHSNLEPFLKKMDFFFKKSTKQKSFLSHKTIEGKGQEARAFSLYKVQSSGVFFNEIFVADKLSRKTRKTNMQIPALEKITCSYTGKELVSSPTDLSLPMCALTFLSGQNSTIVWAKKSVSSWKLRKNCVIGCKVTLRRKFAFVFLDKLYVYGRQGLLEKKNNFLNHFAFCFGVSKNKDFIELQKSDGLSFSFSGFSVSIK